VQPCRVARGFSYKLYGSVMFESSPFSKANIPRPQIVYYAVTLVYMFVLDFL